MDGDFCLIVYAELYGIDYVKFLSRLQKERARQSLLSSFLLRFAKSAFILKRVVSHPLLMKKQIVKLADYYGVTFSVLMIGDDVLIQNRLGGRSMLNISVSVDSIDYGKIVDIIGESAKGGTNSVLPEVARILKPFIGETMATVPPSAIAELFDLLGKDKVVGLLGNYGIAVSEVSVEAG